MLPSTLEVLDVAQINFLALFAFLLFWRRRDKISGGIWLGVGIIIKPILLIVLIYPLFAAALAAAGRGCHHGRCLLTPDNHRLWPPYVF
ncbi:MAG: DUF2029 domain-containing protein [Chloroflexi bacterium]|nr:DUF2029 domain-containing protein [Chloroflexota bacterium]